VSGEQLCAVVEEHAALRRVASLVARGTPPKDVFAAVTEEVTQLLSADHAGLARNGKVVTVAISGQPDYPPLAGSQWTVEGNVATLAFETGCPGQISGCAYAPSPLALTGREQGGDPGVRMPVIVEGRFWGVTGALVKARQARTRKHIAVRHDDLHPAPHVCPSVDMQVGRIGSGDHMAHRSGGEPPCGGA
jgi:hypothetical protein